jgi:hypothetical protein
MRVETFDVQDLHYTVNSNSKKGAEVTLLKGVSAWFEQGEMAAVVRMHSSASALPCTVTCYTPTSSAAGASIGCPPAADLSALRMPQFGERPATCHVDIVRVPWQWPRPAPRSPLLPERQQQLVPRPPRPDRHVRVTAAAEHPCTHPMDGWRAVIRPPLRLCPPPPQMGVSGSGKTTLLDLISGRTTSGRTSGVVLFGNTSPDRHWVRRHTGYVEQFGR